MWSSRRLQVWSGPALVAATVATCAWFAGRLVSHVGEAEAFDERRHVVATAPQPAGPAPVVSERPSPDGLVTRNMFCSSCTTLAGGGGGGGAGEVSHAVPRLIATQVGHDEAWATIDDPVSGVSGLFPRGGALPGGGIIESIERAAMTVRFSDNTTQRVPLASSSAAVVKPVATTTPKPESPFADRIRSLGNNRWEVDRTLIRELVQAGTGQGAAAKGMRLAPVGKDGKLAGIKVTLARPGSLGQLLGLQQGDTIETVDGQPLDSPERMMELYGRLDDTRRVDLGIKRKGAAQTLIYDLP